MEFGIFDGDKSSKRLYYNGGTPYNLINEDGLQGYWKMNEGSGSVVKDFSNEGNDGTIVKILGIKNKIFNSSTFLY